MITTDTGHLVDSDPFDDDSIMDSLMDDAIASAIEEHRRLGQSIVVERNGEIVEIPPDEIPPYTPPKRRASA